MKKIYLVTEYFHQNQNTTGYLFHKLFEHLKREYGSNLSLIVKEDKHNDVIDPDSIIVKDSTLNKKTLFSVCCLRQLFLFAFLFK